MVKAKKTFGVYGPYPIEGLHNKLIVTDASSEKNFWAQVEEDVPGLSTAIGCYVFTLKASGPHKPYYVGKTENSFKRESLEGHKIKVFNQVLKTRKRGTPELFFLPQITPKGRFVKRSEREKRAIKALETILIAWAFEVNENIKNIRGTKMLREIVIPGFMNSPLTGRPSSPVQYLREAFGI